MNNDNIQPMIDRYKRELLELSRKNKKSPSMKMPAETAKPVNPAIPPVSGKQAVAANPNVMPTPPMAGNRAGTAMPNMPMTPPMGGNPMGTGSSVMPGPPPMNRPVPHENAERDNTMDQMHQPFMPYRGTDREFYSGEHYIPYEEFVRQSTKPRDFDRQPFQNINDSGRGFELGEKDGMNDDFNMFIPKPRMGSPFSPLRPEDSFYEDYDRQRNLSMPDRQANPPLSDEQGRTENNNAIQPPDSSRWGLGDEDEMYDDIKTLYPKIRPVVPYSPSRTGEQVNTDYVNIPPLPPTVNRNDNMDLRRSQKQPNAPQPPVGPSGSASAELGRQNQTPAMNNGTAQNIPGMPQVPSGQGNMPRNAQNRGIQAPPVNAGASNAPIAGTPSASSNRGVASRNEAHSSSGIINDPESKVLQATTGTTGTQPIQPGTTTQGGRLFLNRQYASIEEFNQVNPKKGYLKVQVFAGDRAFPISGAHVVVFREINGKNYNFYDKVTDISGLVTGLELPAPDKNLSLKPTDIAPYSTYNIAVDHPKFVSAEFDNVPVFDGIESIQPARMIPKITGAGAPQVKRTIEAQPHDL